MMGPKSAKDLRRYYINCKTVHLFSQLCEQVAARQGVNRFDLTMNQLDACYVQAKAVTLDLARQRDGAPIGRPPKLKGFRTAELAARQYARILGVKASGGCIFNRGGGLICRTWASYADRLLYAGAIERSGEAFDIVGLDANSEAVQRYTESRRYAV